MNATLDLFRVQGKIALVTGGAGIVGKPIARALSEAGATVIIAARNTERCNDFAQLLRKEGLAAEAEHIDLASEDDIRSVKHRVLQRYGRIDILVNNAVARAGGDLRSMTAQHWEETMRVNSLGFFLACQILSEPMQRQCSGSIINISSMYGVVGPTFSIYEGTRMTNPANYAFAKGGIISFTRYLASFLSPFGVRVNCISPGGFRTADTPESFVDNYSRQTLLARMAREDDIKGPVVFLASDASSYITGQNIIVDGGWTAI